MLYLLSFDHFIINKEVLPEMLTEINNLGEILKLIQAHKHITVNDKREVASYIVSLARNKAFHWSISRDCQLPVTEYETKGWPPADKG